MPPRTQDLLAKVRRPRVNITYDVETGGALEKKELPFVVGVLADLSGHNAKNLPPLRERKFTQVSKETLDDVMADIKPGLNIRVPNQLAKDGSELGVQLEFKSMDDFSPDKIAEQVEPLKKLLEDRQKLKNALAQIDAKVKLEGVLEEVLNNQEKLQKLAQELGVKPETTGGAS